MIEEIVKTREENIITTKQVGKESSETAAVFEAKNMKINDTSKLLEVTFIFGMEALTIFRPGVSS